MNCTDCTNTVPLSSGQYPKYVRPNQPPYTTYLLIGDSGPRDPLCRICWEKAVEALKDEGKEDD